jgi:hypothetical protein
MAAGILFAVVYASAASITVSGGFIQEGSDDDLSCSAEAEARVKMWNYEQESGKITSITFYGMEADCVPGNLYVKVYDGDSVLADGRHVTATDDFKVNLEPAIDPVDDLRLQVIVTGGENE